MREHRATYHYRAVCGWLQAYSHLRLHQVGRCTWQRVETRRVVSFHIRTCQLLSSYTYPYPRGFFTRRVTHTR
jgi:hypothetical protein